MDLGIDLIAMLSSFYLPEKVLKLTIKSLNLGIVYLRLTNVITNFHVLNRVIINQF